MRRPSIFTLYCLLVLAAFSVTKYQGYALFGTRPPQPGEPGRTGGSSGYHK